MLLNNGARARQKGNDRERMRRRKKERERYGEWGRCECARVFAGLVFGLFTF